MGDENMLGLIDESELDLGFPEDALKFLRAQIGKFDKEEQPAAEKIPEGLIRNKDFVIKAIKQPHNTVGGSILYRVLNDAPRLLANIDVLAHIDVYYKKVRCHSLDYIIEDLNDFWMKLYLKELRQSQRYKNRYQEVEDEREKNRASGPKELRGIFSIDDVD
jgi:hypothetical protein